MQSYARKITFSSLFWFSLLIIASCSDTENSVDSTVELASEEPSPFIESATPALEWNKSLGDTAYLIDRTPGNALAYFRFPSLWGMLSAPKGNNFDAALRSSANQEELEALQSQLSTEITTLLPPPVAPMAEVLLERLRSPLELVVLPPENNAVMNSLLVLSGRLEFSTVELFNVFLAETIGLAQGITLIPNNQNEGAGIVSLGDITMHYDYEFSTRRLTAIIGAQTSNAQLDAVRNWSEINANQELLAMESRIDSSGYGMFGWSDVDTIVPIANEFLTSTGSPPINPQDLLGVSTIAFGEGVANGAGNFSVILGGNDSVLFDSTLSELAPPDISLKGEPQSYFSLRIPDSNWIDRVSTALLGESAINALESEIGATASNQNSVVGEEFSVEQMIEGIAGYFSYVSDSAGRYLVFSPEDPSAFESMLTNLSGTDVLDTSNFQYGNLEIQELKFTYSFTPTEIPIIDRIGSRFYINREGDDFVIAQVPQILQGRTQITQSTSSLDWQGGNSSQLNKSLFSLVGRSMNVPRNNYYNYLAFLQVLGDVADYEIDISSFPTSIDLQLPVNAKYGANVNFAENEIAMQLSYDSHPYEFLSTGGSMGAVAVAGIVAAVAIPAYQNYSDRAGFSELVLAATPRKTAVELTVSSRNLKGLGDLDGGRFGIPEDIPATASNHGASVVNGEVIMTWRSDGTAMAGTTYILSLQSIAPPLQWQEGGSCVAMGYC